MNYTHSHILEIDFKVPYIIKPYQSYSMECDVYKFESARGNNDCVISGMNKYDIESAHSRYRRGDGVQYMSLYINNNPRTSQDFRGISMQSYDFKSVSLPLTEKECFKQVINKKLLLI